MDPFWAGELAQMLGDLFFYFFFIFFQQTISVLCISAESLQLLGTVDTPGLNLICTGSKINVKKVPPKGNADSQPAAMAVAAEL